MKQKILTMLQMQDAMNTRVNENWRVQGFEWYRAIWIESAELLDHYGWKWWKKQEPDREQVILELIDIWHFGLSTLLTENSDNDKISEHIEKELTIVPAGQDFGLALEDFARQTLLNKQFNLPEFGKLMFEMQLDFSQLYRSYVGKNVLNFFRQDHGYQDGSYVKIWGGKEDNEHLVEIVEGLDDSRNDFREAVYQGLTSRYESLAI